MVALLGSIRGWVRWVVLALLPPIKKLVEEKNALAAQLGPTRAGSTNCGDGIFLRGKNIRFGEEKRFQQAYAVGMGSGHKLDKNIDLRWRVHVALWAASHAMHRPGDFAECGVSTGIMSLAICDYFDFKNTNKSFYLFDTFEGIPLEQAEPDELNHVKELNESSYYDSYELAKKNFSPYPNALLVKGRIPESLQTVKIDQVGYVHIDLNVAKPERDALEFFWPKLVSGGVILLDDYGFEGYEAQHESANAFVEKLNATETYRENKVMMLALPTGQGLIIKP